jgi:peptidoglycan hydrolase-like protein with peptidoglycan-binding domain
MKRLAAIAILTGVASAGLAVTASAQQPAPPTYVQPLGPQAVRTLQEHLRAQGLYTGRTDGIWGPDSQAALERFQQMHGLQVTGQVNQATAATLGLDPVQLLAGSPPQAPITTLSVEAVRNIQTRLKQLGYYGGTVDGVWGPEMQSALTRFQQGQGLQASGQINPATVTAMGLDPNNLTVVR